MELRAPSRREVSFFKPVVAFFICDLWSVMLRKIKGGGGSENVFNSFREVAPAQWPDWCGAGRSWRAEQLWC